MGSTLSTCTALDKIYVALDLETTGLESNRDQIIEVGAVKFRGYEVMENFETYVNPYTVIPEFVQRLTGIRERDVRGAPPFAVISGRLLDFIGEAPIVGHNVSFDLDFLSKHGLVLNNPHYDTWDLAAVLLPNAPEYSLSLLAKSLGISHSRPHRALDDADITRQVFLTLLAYAQNMNSSVLTQIKEISDRAEWGVGNLLPNYNSNSINIGNGVENLQSLTERLSKPQALKKVGEVEHLDVDKVMLLASTKGVLSKYFPGFEYRGEQVEIIEAVTRAFNNNTHLMMEGGTGVGKTVGYLLPSILFALKNRCRVVISTNTINLQEQLIQKDIPSLSNALQKGREISGDGPVVVSLKGRANYLCIRRWVNMIQKPNMTIDEARLLSKCFVWIQETATGDRGEMNLAGRDSTLWPRVSAGEKGSCIGLREGTCFLRAARERAEGSHVIVVNHALLLADLARGGGLIPDYQHLIIDEAHHLEEEATKQLGFRVSEEWLSEQMESVSRLMVELQILSRGRSTSSMQRKRIQDRIESVDEFTPRIRGAWVTLWRSIEEVVQNHRDLTNNMIQLRVTRSTRNQPGWSKVEIAWENCDVALLEIQNRMSKLHTYLETLDIEGTSEWDTISSGFDSWLEECIDLRNRLQTIVRIDSENKRIDWITQESDSVLVFHSAPLSVGDTLKTELFNQKQSVILSSATLSTRGNFDFFRERLGVQEVDELKISSPFDYKKLALLAIADDIPFPGAPGYRECLEKGITSIVKEAGGHTLVLFTSHSTLRAVRQSLIQTVEREGLTVIGQGIDGSPHRVMRRFIDNPDSVLLGTSSFWEGIDMPRGVLKVLVLTRLPFNVPSDPIFSARSELYEDSFREYAVPQAILRFRQGFGRLIRNSADKGVVVVMDRRILGKSYGRMFLESLPDCTVKVGPMSEIGGYVKHWQ